MMEHPDDVTLDAYVEQLLDDDARAALDAHLATCARCRDEIGRQRALLDALRALPARVAPDADLRASIRDGLRTVAAGEARRRALRGLRVPLAAAAVLLVAVSAGVTALLLSDRERAPELAQNIERPVVAVSFDARRAEYTRTANELATLLDRHRAELAPETVALVEENLRTIDRALGEAEAALRADPASATVRELILATQEHKVDVLRWANSLVEG